MEGTSSFLDLRCKKKLDFWIQKIIIENSKKSPKKWNLEKNKFKFKLRLKEGVSFFRFKFIQYYDIYIYIYARLDIGHTSYMLKIILHMCHKHIRTWILYMHLGSGSGYIYLFICNKISIQETMWFQLSSFNPFYVKYVWYI